MRRGKQGRVECWLVSQLPWPNSKARVWIDRPPLAFQGVDESRTGGRFIEGSGKTSSSALHALVESFAVNKQTDGVLRRACPVIGKKDFLSIGSSKTGLTRIVLVEI